MNLWDKYNQIKLWQLMLFCLITLIVVEFIGIQLFDLLSKHIAPEWHNEVFKNFRYGGIIGWIIETIKFGFRTCEFSWVFSIYSYLLRSQPNCG